MPKNVGKYEQGHIETKPDFGDHSAGDKIPPRAPLAPAPPMNERPHFDNEHHVSNNDAHKV